MTAWRISSRVTLPPPLPDAADAVSFSVSGTTGSSGDTSGGLFALTNA